MNFKLRSNLSCIFILVSSMGVMGQQNGSNMVSCRREIPKLMEIYKVPAVGIGVIESGQLKQILMFGDLKKNNPAPYNTIFNVASLTKPVTTMLTLTLVSTGKWDLDEPLYKYWVDPDVINNPNHLKLTTRHVLTHQTGFDNWRTDNKSKKLLFNFDPGTKVKYSGEGFEYLRHALESKFKMSLERLADSLIFRPFKMTDTRFIWDSSVDESRYALPHDIAGNPMEIPRNITSSAADLLKTTIEDYCKFGIEVLKGTGLSDVVFNDMIRPQAVIDEDESFGLGWDITRMLSNGEYALMHSGHDSGSHTIVILIPRSQRGLVVFTNGENGDKIYERIIAGFLDIGEEIVGLY